VSLTDQSFALLQSQKPRLKIPETNAGKRRGNAKKHNRNKDGLNKPALINEMRQSIHRIKRQHETLKTINAIGNFAQMTNEFRASGLKQTAFAALVDNDSNSE
jgi:hypothetical protein